MRRLIGIQAVERLTGRSRTTIRRYRAAAEIDFPRPVELGPRDLGWFEDEVLAWIETRPRVGPARGASAVPEA